MSLSTFLNVKNVSVCQACIKHPLDNSLFKFLSYEPLLGVSTFSGIVNVSPVTKIRIIKGNAMMKIMLSITKT